MFWLGGLVGLVVGAVLGATVGVVGMCAISIHRVNEMGDVLDKCRRELALYAWESGTARAICDEAAKVLKDQGWWAG